MNVNKITGSTDWTFQTLNLKSNKQESLLVDPLIQWFYNVNPLNDFLLGLAILILLITHNFLKREKDKYLLQYPKERLRVHLRISTNVENQLSTGFREWQMEKVKIAEKQVCLLQLERFSLFEGNDSLLQYMVHFKSSDGSFLSVTSPDRGNMWLQHTSME